MSGRRGIDGLDTDLVTDIIRDEIDAYITTGLKFMDTGTPDGLDTETWKRAIHQARHLNLAEPWLPAVRAAQRLRAAGLATMEGAPGS
jgi:hypothetical protein